MHVKIPIPEEYPMAKPTVELKFYALGGGSLELGVDLGLQHLLEILQKKVPAREHLTRTNR